jgi:hypothetical protein
VTNEKLLDTVRPAMTIDAQPRRDFAPGRYGILAGFALGVVLLVLAPMVAPPSNYLIPNHWKVTLMLAGLASLAGVFALGRGAVRWALALSLGVMCAFAIRVAIDTSHDRTTHNLLPFELVGDFTGTLLWSIGGAALGFFARRFADRAEESETWTPRWKRPGR